MELPTNEVNNYTQLQGKGKNQDDLILRTYHVQYFKYIIKFAFLTLIHSLEGGGEIFLVS